jgi:hypothetical protein
MAPMYVGWKCFPHHKAVISGLIFTANGCGSIIYSIYAPFIVNPDNEALIVNADGQLYYSDENGVASNTIQLFRIFAYIALAILVITTLTIYIPPSSVVLRGGKNDDNKNLSKNVWKAVRSK